MVKLYKCRTPHITSITTRYNLTQIMQTLLKNLFYPESCVKISYIFRNNQKGPKVIMLPSYTSRLIVTPLTPIFHIPVITLKISRIPVIQVCLCKLLPRLLTLRPLACLLPFFNPSVRSKIPTTK